MDMEKKSPLRDVMNSTMEKVREMVDANNIVGAPITTPDGVTLIPISKDGTTRVMPVAVPPVSTVDRIVDMAPDIVDKIGKFFDKKDGDETV